MGYPAVLHLQITTVDVPLPEYVMPVELAPAAASVRHHLQLVRPELALGLWGLERIVQMPPHAMDPRIDSP